jgi:MFS family permease
MSATVRRPPLAVVLVALVMLALGETAGAAMSRLKPEIQRYAAARVAANPGAHGFSGSAEYDDEVRERAVFTAEAGLSFFHLHGEGVGLVLFFASALAAALVPRRRARGALYLLLTVGGLFPLGYLVYGAAVLELGRDAGIELAERWILAPLGVSAIAGLAGLWLLVEQNARVALSVCDRGYIMEKGSIVFEASSRELRESPVTREKLGV